MAESGLSMAEVVRLSIRRTIEEQGRKKKWRRALAVIGRYQSGESDISVEHDKYLDKEYL